MFGIAREAALGRAVAELVVPERFREAHESGLRRFLTDGVGPMLDRRVELSALRLDGSEFPVEMTVSAFQDGTEWTFTAFLQDISARRDSEREQFRLVEELRRTLVGSERRFDAIVGSLADPVTIRDRENRIVYANRAALTHLGFESVEALAATAPELIMADYIVMAEDGTEISMDRIPSVRLLRGDSAEPLLIRTIHKETRAERWNLLKASPLLDDAGAVEATIMVIEDVTEQKLAELRSAFLAQASDVLASSLDYEQTLRNVAQLAVPDIVDWCAVDLLDTDGDRISVAVAHVDPARLELAEELRAYEPEQLDPEQGLGLVLRTGRPALYPEISDELLVEAAVNERHLDLLRQVGFRSAAIVPMRIGTRTLGAMTLVNAESGRALGQSDVELAEQIAGRAAVAIENARIYSERSSIAHTLQQSLLPEQLPELPGYELAAAYLPAFEGTEVGGDFYDVWETHGGWMVAMGDVAGKGVEAAALTSLIRHTLRATAEFVSSPAELLARLDLTLKKQRVRSICTALCLRLEDDHLTLAIGGHPLPIWIDASGAREIGKYGSLLGAFVSVEWQDIVLQFTPQTTLVMYTDGVTDAVGRDGERYGARRLRATLDRCRQLSASEVIQALTSSVGEFQVGEHADDTAVLALRRLAHDVSLARSREARETGQTEAMATAA
jgi:PAS domain S-box-containing protein